MSPDNKKRTPKADVSPPPISRRRKVWFALAAVLVVPVLALGILEIGLRVFGYGYPTSFLLKQEANGIAYWVDNDKFGWRFFPKELARSPTTLKFAAQKESGTYRIFVFGESAALGDPKPAFSMGRYLEVLLRERFPATKFEVITAAMTAVNSHALLPMARECARLNGDFWVVYMGNNEMAGPFGVNPISGPSAPDYKTVRLSLALRTLKIGQWMENVAASLRGKTETRSEWEGVKMFRENQVAPADPRKEIIYANFRQNLRDIVRAGLSSGAKPIVCTVAGNLRDFAPLASIGSTNEAYAQGVRLQAEGRLEEAAEAFRKALPAGEAYADLHFRLGQLSHELGTSNAVVRGHFEKARDLDALPLRTDGRINGILRELASAESGAKLVDLDRDIGTPLAGQTPGDETFYDHVHFTFMGNYRAARLIATEIEKNLLAEVSAKRSVNWASAPLCDRALGLTDWNRRSAFENMMRRQMEPPFTDQSNYTNRIEGLARAVANLREGLTGRAAADAFAIYQEALTRNESDFRLRESFAEFLEAAGRFPEAAEQRKAIAAWVPHDSVAAYHAGRVLAGIKQGVEARAHLQRALQLRPNFPEAHLEIGRSYALEGMHEEALRAYDQALQQRPEYVSALMQKAHSYAAIARRKEAKSMLREAIRISPENWEARYMLAIELAADNEMAEAIVQFNEVTRLRPTYAQAYFNLSVALAKAGRLREAYLGFQKTLELDPEHKSASEYLSAMAREFSR